MPHYALVMDDGDALGAVELEGDPRTWSRGAVIERGDGPNLRVVGHLPAADPERFSVLVVQLAG